MSLVYPFFIAFAFVFISELGDKTQLFVLSFAGKAKTYKILLGVAIGSFFSHGIAILFGSQIGILQSVTLHHVIELITYASFIVMGFLSLLPKKETLSFDDASKGGFFNKLCSLKLNYCFLTALCIMVGEIGDKTFLASVGLGVQYPNSKMALIFGAITAMVLCDFIAIVFGKFLNKYVSEKWMRRFSGVLFLIFGLIGFFSM